MTEVQAGILRHALGDNGKKGIKLGYRNFYSTYEGQPDCETLVEQGLMVKGQKGLYHVSQLGKDLLGVKETQ